MKIGDIAKRTGLKVETVRFYEGEGLIDAPRRSGGNYRLYDESHLDRLTSSNRVGCKRFLRCRCREHGRLRGRHMPPHDGASRVTLPRFITHFIAMEA